MNEHIGRRTLLAAASLAAGGAVLAGGDPAAAGTASTSGRLRSGGEFDRYVARLAAEGKFSGTVVLAHRGRTVLERGYGMADRARSIPCRPSTIFSLASLTKFFTSIAIAQLVERGKVGYDDPVGAHLDGYAPEVADKVAIHHLLTHTSGLGDHMQLPGFWEEAPTWDTVEEVWEGTLRYVRKDTLAFAPGSGNRYSNGGYVTLGAIVAAVSGQSYYDYVREHVFRPAGATASDFYTTPVWRADPRFARPYRPGSADPVEHPLLVGSPAGSSFATAADMARIVAAVRDGRLLSPIHYDLASGPKLPLPKPPGGGVAFSNYLTNGALTDGQWSLGHGGGAPGVSTNFSWYPQSGWTCVVLSNYDNAAAQVASTARRIITG